MRPAIPTVFRGGRGTVLGEDEGKEIDLFSTVRSEIATGDKLWMIFGFRLRQQARTSRLPGDLRRLAAAVAPLESCRVRIDGPGMGCPLCYRAQPLSIPSQ